MERRCRRLSVNCARKRRRESLGIDEPAVIRVVWEFRGAGCRRAAAWRRHRFACVGHALLRPSFRSVLSRAAAQHGLSSVGRTRQGELDAANGHAGRLQLRRLAPGRRRPIRPAAWRRWQPGRGAQRPDARFVLRASGARQRRLVRSRERHVFDQQPARGARQPGRQWQPPRRDWPRAGTHDGQRVSGIGHASAVGAPEPAAWRRDLPRTADLRCVRRQPGHWRRVAPSSARAERRDVPQRRPLRADRL